MKKKDSGSSAFHAGSGMTIGAAIGLLFGTLLLGAPGALAGVVVGIVSGMIWDLQKREQSE